MTQTKSFFSSLVPFFSLFFLFFQPFLSQGQNLPNFVEIVKTEKSKVVHIATTTKVKNNANDPFFNFFPNLPKERKESALGSGFFYSPEGLVITNNHVIHGAEKIDVILDDNRSYSAKVIGADERTDLALLKVDAKGTFPVMKFGDSNKLEVGEWVLAIGNPLGLDQTVTAGIVSAKNRDILGGTAYGQFIQTDAAINFGNSGGPLLNTKGEVVGINTAIAGGQGLGFAIPSNLASKIIEQLKKGGKVVRGWLGVGIQDLTPEITSSMKFPNGQKGVLITQIYPDSPAKKAGLQEQDLIIEVNGSPVNKSNELQRTIAETPPGQQVQVTVLRNGSPTKKTIKIEEFKNDTLSKSGEEKANDFGLVLLPVTQELKKEFNLSVNGGLFVKDIDPESTWAEKIQAGDVILKANGKNVNRVSDFEQAMKEVKKDSSFVILIHRAGRQMVVAITKP